MDERTLSRQVGQALQEQHQFSDPFAAAVRATRMPMIVTDALQHDNPIVFANAAFLSLTGYPEAEVVGRNCRFLQGPDTDREAVARIRDAVLSGTDVAEELLNYRKDGTPFWNALYISPVRNEAGEILYFFASQLDVSDKKRSEFDLLSRREALERAVEERTRELQGALDQKTILLNEVDHRVKNNLQLISSLIVLQMRRTGDDAVKRALADVLSRVTAISTVHRRLFQGDDVGRFDVADFVVDLTDDLGAGASQRGIEIDLALEPVGVTSNRAAPVALIVNELVGNALRHAFVGRETGTVRIEVSRKGDHYCIAVQDDGVGLDWGRATPTSSGRYIVELLARQLKAEVEWSDARPGTRVSVTVPVNGSK